MCFLLAAMQMKDSTTKNCQNFDTKKNKDNEPIELGATFWKHPYAVHSSYIVVIFIFKLVLLWVH
jgi:hypothetical protein